MRVTSLNRMFLTAAISIVSMAGLNMSAGVQRADNQQQQVEKEKQRGNAPGQQKKAPPAKSQQQSRQSDRPPTVQSQQQARPQQPAPRLTQPQQQVRIIQQQQRSTQYGLYLGQQRNLAQQRSVRLQQDHRTNQYQFQLLYIARLNQQQLAIQNSRGYNYGGDPYFYTPSSYRYSRGGRSYETNQYGADLLRHAVNYGYDEGYRAGIADRRDRWTFSYQDSYAYQDATFGYAGYYVDRDDYNFYFREGFRRGYDDGYNSRNQYGHYSNGSYSVLGPTLSVILNLQSFH